MIHLRVCFFFACFIFLLIFGSASLPPWPKIGRKSINEWHIFMVFEGFWNTRVDFCVVSAFRDRFVVNFCIVLGMNSWTHFNFPQADLKKTFNNWFQKLCNSYHQFSCISMRILLEESWSPTFLNDFPSFQCEVWLRKVGAQLSWSRIRTAIKENWW